MEQNSCPAWSVWSQLRCQRRRSSSVSFYTVLKVSPRRLRWLWSTFGLDPSSDTLLIFRRYNFQKSSLRELHKEYNKYYLKYHGSKGLVSSSSSFFPKRISAAERRGQVTLTLRNRACRYASLVNANFSVNQMCPIICRWKLVKHRYCFGDNRRTKDNRKIRLCGLKACCMT